MSIRIIQCDATPRCFIQIEQEKNKPPQVMQSSLLPLKVNAVVLRDYRHWGR